MAGPQEQRLCFSLTNPRPVPALTIRIRYPSLRSLVTRYGIDAALVLLLLYGGWAQGLRLGLTVYDPALTELAPAAASPISAPAAPPPPAPVLPPPGPELAYVNTYAPLARREMAAHGIPASITLAQGILESRAGRSPLATESRNHFGIKCRRRCLGCTCRNYGDDSRYDMFRVFDSAAASFREHSRLLNSPRYAGLKRHGTDYVRWAHGLRACGYATDPRYGHKLVRIIERLGLAVYDRPPPPPPAASPARCG